MPRPYPRRIRNLRPGGPWPHAVSAVPSRAKPPWFKRRIERTQHSYRLSLHDDRRSAICPDASSAEAVDATGFCGRPRSPVGLSHWVTSKRDGSPGSMTIWECFKARDAFRRQSSLPVRGPLVRHESPEVCAVLDVTSRDQGVAFAPCERFKECEFEVPLSRLSLPGPSGKRTPARSAAPARSRRCGSSLGCSIEVRQERVGFGQVGR